MSAFDDIFYSVYGLIDYSDFKAIYRELEKEENIILNKLVDNYISCDKYYSIENEFRKIYFIAKRINLVSRLHRADEGELILYILLTCFDILGENKEWVSFDEWLKSREKKNERNTVFNKINGSKELIQKVREIYSQYNKIYSVRTSFNNFIDNILPEKVREQLLGSIRKTRSALKDSVVEVQYSNRVENKKLLFELRNRFTHRGVGVPLSIDNHLSPCWTIYPGLFGINSNIEFYDWPAILFYAVKEGFVEYLKQFNPKNDTSQGRKHFLLKVDDFIPSPFDTWEIEYLEDLTADRLLRQIACALNSQGSKREIRIAGYGFDWVIKNLTTDRILTDLTIKIGDAPDMSLKECDISPNSILKVIDIQDKLNFSDKFLHVKRKLSNGSYLYATYQNRGLVEFGDEKDGRFFDVKEFQEVTHD